MTAGRRAVLALMLALANLGTGQAAPPLEKTSPANLAARLGKLVGAAYACPEILKTRIDNVKKKITQALDDDKAGKQDSSSVIKIFDDNIIVGFQASLKQPSDCTAVEQALASLGKSTEPGAGTGLAKGGPAEQDPQLSSSHTDNPAGFEWLSPVPKSEIFRDCAGCPEMVVIPAGEFSMGSSETPYEKPIHKVVIASPFAIGRREVTFEEWDRCFSAGGCKHWPEDHGWGRGRRPVIDISWDDAKTFLAWLSRITKQPYRLPTEAEWEYAARAGTNSPFWWGRSTTGNAVCEDCSTPPPRQTMPAGSIQPNGFGIYDVAGNAAEWVEDCWNESYHGAPADGTPWTTGQCRQRVLRGGSFASKMAMIRSAARFRYDQDVRYYANGFRVARDMK
jgi:formylglycine-generating enzyme required for sulfatase activity